MKKSNGVMITATNPAMVAILKRMGCKQEVRTGPAQGDAGTQDDVNTQGDAGAHAYNEQSTYSQSEHVLHTAESLDKLERKDLFAITESYGMDYPPNTPTVKLIDQILAHQSQRG